MAAHAQSSVTLYGRIDNGFRFETGLPGGHRFNAESGDWGCSWLGLQGSEDLGGGTQAIFQLESLLNTQTGALWGNLFARHATIGMTNARMGTLKLGNLGAGELSQDKLVGRSATHAAVRNFNPCAWSQLGKRHQRIRIYIARSYGSDLERPVRPDQQLQLEQLDDAGWPGAR